VAVNNPPLKEEIMVEVSPAALKQLEDYFAGKSREPIRVYLAAG
jgi:hypothetical protein